MRRRSGVELAEPNLAARSANRAWLRFEIVGLASLAVAAMIATVLSLTLVTVVLARSTPSVAGLLGWCDRLASGLPWWVTAPVAAYMVFLVTGGVSVTIRHLKSRPVRGSPGLLVVDDARPVAYSLGGRGGQIVASTGLLEELTEVERQVVFAHEAAHIRLSHHRLLWLGDVVALNPLLRPLRNRLRFALERAADEEAVRRVGDRAVVARTVSRVALLSVGKRPAESLGMSGSGVVDRVEALLVPSAVPPPTRAVGAAVLTLAVGVVVTSSQLPHLVGLVSHICAL